MSTHILFYDPFFRVGTAVTMDTSHTHAQLAYQALTHGMGKLWRGMGSHGMGQINN
jgi:hypothetical protein